MTRRRHRLTSAAFIACAVVMLACNLGHQPEDFPPAVGPTGARVILRVNGETEDRTGELFAVDSAGVLLRGTRLLRVRWRELSAMDVPPLRRDYRVSVGETVDATKRERLALVSRFPQGLSGALLDRVLALIPQQAVDSLR